LTSVSSVLSMKTRVFAGLLQPIRVLDLADEKAAFCSKVLADLGASVIKIEKPGGDSSRRIGPFLGESPFPERSLSFWHANTNKQGITLDIEQEEGKALFLKLVKKSDIVVESFAPGYLDGIGVGFPVLSQANPGLILASVTGFGQDGPRSRYKSCDLVASAFGGQMYVSGATSSTPLKPYGEQSAYVASLYAAIAILLALRRRNGNGKGAHIDISSQECVASSLDHVLARYFYGGVIATRRASLSWNNSSFILPCRDGHIFLTLFPQWDTLVEWMASEGMEEDLGEEKWKEERYRLGNIDHVIDVVRRWTLTHTVQELFELGQALRFPWAPVSRPRDVLQNTQLQARNFFVPVDHPELGTTVGYPGVPYVFSPPREMHWKGAPSVGEDNLRIYRDELGLSDAELKRLACIKVI
jgi:benzylsuccinate CoA-transferase BbsE subunit